ncbi:MAG: hypothetical protein ACN6O2_01210 [Stenotrophomonas sp.]
MSKEKFDLSNVGGQPRTWAEKNREASLQASLSFSDYLGCAGIIVCLLAVVGGLAAAIFDFNPVPKQFHAPLVSIGVFAFFFFAAKELVDMKAAKRDETKRAIENTWSKLTQVEASLQDAINEERRENLVKMARFERTIIDLEQRLSDLEKRDQITFGD